MKIQANGGVQRRHLLASPLGLALGAAMGSTPARPSSAAPGSRVVKPQINRAYAEGPYGLIHYRWAGEGIPLVLIHQAPMSARQFDAVYPVFAAKGVCAIGIDLPGFGDSDPTPFVPKIEDWAKVVPVVLDKMRIKRAHMAGHHTGAVVATEVTLQFPHRVRKLVMHGALPVTDKERAARLARVQNEERNVTVYQIDGSHLSKAFQVRFRAYGPGADPKVITRYVTEQFSASGEFWWGHNAAYEYDHTAAMKKVVVPTQLMTNEKDVIKDLTKRAIAIRPDFHFVELPGGGVADVADQMPEAWAESIYQFISR